MNDKIKISDIIIETDRIRDDFYNVENLAEQIKADGQIAPVVIEEGTNILVDGECRIRACRDILGWDEVKYCLVPPMSKEKRDSLQFNSNEARSNFTMTEKLKYGQRMEESEVKKAEERMKAHQYKSNSENSTAVEQISTASEPGKTRDIVAKALGISGKQYDKMKFIVAHKEYLTDEEFLKWNRQQGYTTSAAYKDIKTAMALAEKRVSTLSKKKDKPVAEKSDVSPSDAHYQAEIESLKSELAALKSKPTSTNNEIINQLTQQLAETQSKLEDTTNRLDEAEAVIQDYNFSKDYPNENLSDKDPLMLLQIETAAAFDTRIHHFIEDLGSARYARFMDSIESEPLIKKSIISVVQNVENWLKDIKPVVIPEVVDSTAVEVEEPHEPTSEDLFDEWAEKEIRDHSDMYHSIAYNETAEILTLTWNEHNPTMQMYRTYVTDEHIAELVARTKAA